MRSVPYLTRAVKETARLSPILRRSHLIPLNSLLLLNLI